jgi:hypothetical protein
MNLATSLVLGVVSLSIGLGMVWFAMPNNKARTRASCASGWPR